MESLHRPVFHRGDAQRPELAVLFGNEHTAERQSTVVPAFQQRQGVPLLLRRLPDNPVDSRRGLSGVRGDTLAARALATSERVRRYCRGFALLILPSRKALAIRF